MFSILSGGADPLFNAPTQTSRSAPEPLDIMYKIVGFRAGRSCIDQIETMRIILEQSLEWQSPVYIKFIDFKKAFNMIDRSTMWRIIRHYVIPPEDCEYNTQLV